MKTAALTIILALTALPAFGQAARNADPLTAPPTVSTLYNRTMPQPSGPPPVMSNQPGWNGWGGALGNARPGVEPAPYADQQNPRR